MSKKENLTRILLCVSIIALSVILISWVNNPRIIDNSNPDIVKVDTSYLIKSVAYSNDTSKRFISTLGKDIFVNTNTTDTIDTVKVDSELNDVKSKLVNEVHTYIRKVAPNYSKDMADYLVDKALESDLDLCFMMCQTQYETRFGTSGIGRAHRKSLFGVIKKSPYSTYDVAIDDYVNLLQTRYLGRGKDEQSLLRSYQNHSGHRYCPSSNYESRLRGIYNGIRKNTNIYTLQKKYKSLS